MCQQIVENKFYLFILGIIYILIYKDKRIRKFNYIKINKIILLKQNILHNFFLLYKLFLNIQFFKLCKNESQNNQSLYNIIFFFQTIIFTL